VWIITSNIEVGESQSASMRHDLSIVECREESGSFRSLLEKRHNMTLIQKEATLVIVSAAVPRVPPSLHQLHYAILMHGDADER
jgi:hypothetical protein